MQNFFMMEERAWLHSDTDGVHERTLHLSGRRPGHGVRLHATALNANSARKKSPGEAFIFPILATDQPHNLPRQSHDAGWPWLDERENFQREVEFLEHKIGAPLDRLDKLK